MIEAKAIALEPLKLENLKELLKAKGPCVTIVLPPYRPGEQAKSGVTLLKSNLQDAARELKAAKTPDDVALGLLAPFYELDANPDFANGSHGGRAMFSAPGMFRQFHLSEAAQPSMTVAGSMYLRGVLPDLHLPAEFYLLKISQKAVELLRMKEMRAGPVALPKGVPSTLDEAMAFDAPDHDLENRSAAGSGVGAMKGVRFGTGSGKETQHTHFGEFFRKVDHGLADFLRARKATLVLVGVDEDTAIYHSVATYPGLLRESVHGNAKGFLHESEIFAKAYAIERAAVVEQEARELAASRERFGPARFLTDLQKILAAAFEGRLQRIYLSENARSKGPFEGFGYRSMVPEDLGNLAAVQTILHGGDAVALPESAMPVGVNVAGVMRF